MVIDTAADKVVATIPVGQRPWNMALTRDGAKLYVANGRSDSVSVIDTAKNARIKDILHVGKTPWASASSSERIGIRARFSLGLDAGFFDDFSPGLVFARDVAGQLLGRAGLRLDALLVECRLHLRRAERLDELAVQRSTRSFGNRAGRGRHTS